MTIVNNAGSPPAPEAVAQAVVEGEQVAQVEQNGTETTAEPNKQDDASESEREKHLKRDRHHLHRLINKMSEKIGALTEENRRLREQPGQNPQKPDEKPQLTEDEIDRRAEEKAEAKRVNSRMGEISQAGHKEFGKEAFTDAVGAFMQAFDDVHQANEMASLLADSDHAAAIINHLGTNPDEADRFAEMSPRQLAREFGRLETKLANKPVPVKQVSKTPKPIDPVGGKQNSSEELSDDLSDDEWVRRRNKQERNSRRG